MIFQVFRWIFSLGATEKMIVGKGLLYIYSISLLQKQDAEKCKNGWCHVASGKPRERNMFLKLFSERAFFLKRNSPFELNWRYMRLFQQFFLNLWWFCLLPIWLLFSVRWGSLQSSVGEGEVIRVFLFIQRFGLFWPSCETKCVQKTKYKLPVTPVLPTSSRLRNDVLWSSSEYYIETQYKVVKRNAKTRHYVIVTTRPILRSLI